MKPIIRKTFLLLAVILIFAAPVSAQDPTMFADTARVIVKKHTSAAGGNLADGISIDIKQMESFPKFLGNSDPMQYLQTLPGIASNTEMTCGIRVQGCEASQTGTYLCGTRIYGQGHILGLFSLFIPSHFETMTFQTSSPETYIGGYLNFETPDSITKKVHGDVNVGLVSTQGTINFQTGQKSSMSFSARRSFVDIFYKDFFKIDGSSMDYKFYDLNGSWIWKPDSENTIDINGYFGQDDGGSEYGIDGTYVGAVWGNGLGNIRWRHDDGEINSTLQLYGTSYWCDGKGKTISELIGLQSNIADFGINGQLRYRDWKFGADISYYSIQPQDVSLGESKSSMAVPTPRQSSTLYSVSADRSFYLGRFMLRPALTGSIYRDYDTPNTWYHLDPTMRVEYDLLRGGVLDLDFGYKHQYLFQTGITNTGFPIEFWMTCGQYCPPQSALFASLSYEVQLFNRGYSLSTQIYGKRLYNQIEYKGVFSDILTGNYDLKEELLHGDGYNYGFSLMLQKNSGNLTGWISYSYGRALRSFDDEDYPDVYPSSFERLHELNVVASYKINRWEFGGNFIAASGLPYTPATSIYVINDEVLLQYGERNSKRLAPYIRLDLSATFTVSKRKHAEHKLNLSIHNVTGRNNQLMARIKYKDGEYSYSPVVMIIPIIPSISYQCKF